jgi:deoxyribonucleoside regulator
MMSQVQSNSVRLQTDEAREQMMVQAAKLYYDLERTQSEIATELGLTRWQVGRLLREARDVGIVRIEIVPRSPRCTDLEVRLQRALQLREAIVVPARGSEDDGIALESVAKAAGQYLAALTPKVSLLGVSWGRTMSAVAHWLPPLWNDGVHVVLVNGSTNLRDTSNRTQAVAEAFARRGNGTATILPVPAIVGKASTRAVLEEEPMVTSVLELAKDAQVACFGLGALSHSSVLVESGYLTCEQVDALGARGAVGDILGRFVDGDGRIIDPELDSRTLGLGLEWLRKKDRAIAIAAGSSKHQIVRACLRAGYCNVLITDESTARYILESGDGR